jgi:glycosyltransferase involved in cell wall biosynthesis
VRLIQAFFFNNPDNYPPIINGARLLADAGFQVELFCRDDGHRWNISYPEAVKIERIPPRYVSSKRNYLSFCRQVISKGKRDATAFVGHDARGLVPARLLAGRYGRPLVYHCYDYSGNDYSETIGSRILQRLQFGFARKAGLITVPDEGLAQVISKDLRLDRRPIVMVNSPLAQPILGGALRSALKERGREFQKIVFRQGRIGTGHALEVTIRSIPYWHNRKWGFVVMGISEPNYLNSLNELALSLGVADQFVALPPVAYDEVSHFTKDADLGHALYEPIHINNVNISGSCKIHEYMSAGLPLLVSDRPSLRSLVDEYSCGVAADDTSPEEIASAINNFFNSNGKAVSMSMAATRAFQDKFRFEFQFKPVLRTLEDLV